jgi:hypothetical protein
MEIEVYAMLSTHDRELQSGSRTSTVHGSRRGAEADIRVLACRVSRIPDVQVIEERERGVVLCPEPEFS